MTAVLAFPHMRMVMRVHTRSDDHELVARLRAEGAWLGASCVARWREHGFLFAGRIEGGRLVLSGIGGKVEPGESFQEAMRREFREETGVDVDRLVTPPPRHLTPLAEERPVPEGAAALIAERPPQHPAGGMLWIAVYVAVIDSPPRPVEKVALFVVVPPAAERLGVPRLEELYALDGANVRPIGEVLPHTVSEVTAEHTAAAVLAAPRLLSQWWDLTNRRS